MKYRAEIDGLRALAVLPVILFHAGFELFSGGFVGVDVFFVISGYLITTIIISEMAEGKFSIVNFYERRARRILPALFFVMLMCLPFAWMWLTPNDLKDFGKSLVAVSTFSSNILFWRESGYFDTAAELKPLLHTWSLAVEEQYYILFPIFLMFTWRLGLKWILILLSMVFLVSLGIAQWGAYNSPSAAFFLLPTRGWELLVGVFAAFYLKYNTHLKSHSLNQALSLIGFGMIVYSIISFDKNTAFPSLYALIPTIGTGLLILCAVPKTLIHKLLSLKFIVGIGLLSYSAYLWHQPLLAFARHRLLGEVSDVILIVLCVASLAMAWFSWRFVETPFRNRQRFNRTSIFRLSAVGILMFSTIGLTLHFTNGLERLWLLSYSMEERRIYEIMKLNTDYDMYDRMYSSNCKLWAKDVSDLPIAEFDQCSDRFGSPLVVLGDSHAMNLYNIFARSEAYELSL
jgi:peptidoglycan/LPS O-acetylase OafA/YrhL